MFHHQKWVRVLKSKHSSVIFRSFLVCWLCILIPLSGIVVSNTVQSYQTNEKRYISDAQKACNELLELLAMRFEYAFIAGQTIFSSQWYQHYLNIANLYQDEFHPPAQIEKVNSLIHTVTTLDFVSDIVIAVPVNNAVISTNGWLTMDMYQQCYGHQFRILAEEGENIAPELQVLDSRYFAHRLYDGVPRHKQSSIHLIFNRKRMENYILPLLPENFQSVCLNLNGSCIWTMDNIQGKQLTVSAYSHYPALTLTASIPVFWQIYRSTQLSLTLSAYLLLLVGSCILSFGVTRLIHLPLKRLIRHKAPVYNHQHPLDALEHMLDQNTRLQNRNNEITSYFGEMQSGILFSLLTNPDVSAYDAAISEAFPWLMENHPCLLSVSVADQLILPIVPLYNVVVRLPDGICRALWFTDEESAHQEYHRRLRIKNELSLNLLCKFYDCMNSGKITECMELLSRERDRYPISAFERLLTRYANEKEMVCTGLNGTWQGVETFMNVICKSVETDHRVKSKRSAKALCEYIEDNYTNPDMSIKLLCEEFHIGRTMISQLVKEHSDKTFSEYLTDLRLEKACQLLREKREESTSVIGECVGYISYSTFKRAFQRKYGISPRVWRENAEQADFIL